MKLGNLMKVLSMFDQSVDVRINRNDSELTLFADADHRSSFVARIPLIDGLEISMSLDGLLGAIRNSPESDGWHRAGNAPTSDTVVLILTDSGLYTSGSYHPEDGWKFLKPEVQMGHAQARAGTVKYWRNLPAPPKEGSDG
jgi:hypothetical protein